MSEFRYHCLFLLAEILAGLLAGTGITSKFVCPADSVQLFKLTNFDSCNSVVSLFLNGDRNMQIAKWTLQDCTLNSSILPEYKTKLYFNKNGTILINDVHPWDEGRYIMKIDNTLPGTYEEQIYVMALPTKDCRPSIVQLGNSLSASMKHDVCGKPVATQYWKDCCGISYSNESVLKLSPGKEACSCYACIVSPALKCARNSTPLDYCSTIHIGGTITPPVSLEVLDVKTVVAVGIILFILFILMICVIAILKRRRRNAKVQQRFKEFKKSDEMQELLRPTEIQPSTVVEFADTKLGTEETTTRNRRNRNLNLMREKGPHVDRCGLCGEGKVTMFVHPCEHTGSWYVPTCSKCGFLSKPCETCSASHTKNVNKQCGPDFKSYMLTKLKL